MKHNPCNECIGLAVCNNRELDHKLEICSILRSAIVRESNILDPNGLAKLVPLDGTKLRVVLNTHTDSNYIPVKRSKEFVLFYVVNTYHHDYYDQVLLGEYDQVCKEVESFYDKPYIGME